MSVRPLLKWVGGKRQLLPALRRFYPPQFEAYIEPFFGSGAVFFDLWEQGRLTGHPIVLIDSNPDLIGCYEAVRDTPDAVAHELDGLAEAHARDGRVQYYRVRDEQFNPMRAARRTPEGRIAYTPALAAMLIYLNRTGFNGLFRVNASGAFNVPAGRYAKPRISERARLERVADALNSPGVSLRWGSFLGAASARPGDFEVLPVGASLQALQQMVIDLSHRGCHVLLSNSTAPVIADLYDTNPDARDAGLRALRVPARRAINSNAARRGPVDEYVITNVPGTDASG